MRPAQAAMVTELRQAPAERLPMLSELQRRRRCSRQLRAGRPGIFLLLQAAVEVQAVFWVWVVCSLVPA